MGILDWLSGASPQKSAAKLLADLRALVGAVQEHTKSMPEYLSQIAVLAAAIDRGEELSAEHLERETRATDRWRQGQARVAQAQRELYKDVILWRGTPPHVIYNEVIVPAILSGVLVLPSDPAFGHAIVAAYRVCAAAAKERGIQLEAHVGQEILSMVEDAGDLYK